MAYKNQKPLPGIGEGDEYDLGVCGHRLYDAAEDAHIIQHRAEEFELYGFTLDQAFQLAQRIDVDREQVKQMLTQGCIHLMVLEIVL